MYLVNQFLLTSFQRYIAAWLFDVEKARPHIAAKSPGAKILPVGGKGMLKAIRHTVVCALVFLPGLLIAGERFDGNWLTKLTCPAKGSTEGYTWQFPSVIQNSIFHGERGIAGQPGYYTLDGAIKQDGSAKLSANGIVASREYARGVFAHKGEAYSYDVKAKFQDTQGSGTRDAGLGIVGRTCTFDFVKQ